MKDTEEVGTVATTSISDDNDKIEVAVAGSANKDGIAYSITSTTGQSFKADTIVLQGNTVVSKNILEAAETDAARVTSLINAEATYDAVKTAKTEYDKLSTFAKAKVAEADKTKLDGYVAEVNKIDAAVVVMMNIGNSPHVKGVLITKKEDLI